MTTRAERNAMLEKYADSLSEQAREKGQYANHVAKYLDFIGCHELSRASVQRYIDSIRDHYEDGSIKNIFGAIRRFYIVNGLEWPFRRSEAPIVRESHRYAPAIHPDVVADFIKAAKDGKLAPGESAFLALSTTYGLRREELISVHRGDINFEDKLVFVHTMKHGRERWHRLPDEIIPYLQEYDFPKISEYTSRLMFLAIENKSGYDHIPDTGFHAIRRTVISLLEEKFTPGEVHKFLRWSDSDIGDVYKAVVFVGKKQDTPVSPREDRYIDNKILAEHPFVKLWGGKDE